jgi:Cof subfamily protein (haloacid dehalogenase superfamily)
LTVKLVISDVDGTIVQPDKTLSAGTMAAAQRLQAAGVPLAIVSARPPRGMRWISEALMLTAPYAGFNGGALIGPNGQVIEWNPAPAAMVQTALDLFAARGVDAWLFTQDEWLIRDPAGVYVAHERHTVRFEARVVASFAPYVGQVGKLVGVSDDFEKLAAVEAELQGLAGAAATVHRSQQYYLDLTHPNANKGYAVHALARKMGVDVSEVAVLGDMANDVPMFEVAGYSVAMGNGPDAVKAAASATTAANSQEGWAQAVDTLILPRTKP